MRDEAWVLLPLAAVLVGEALRAHRQGEQSVAGPLLTFVHPTAAVLWAGTLLYVLRTLAAWRGEHHHMAGVGMARACVDQCEVDTEKELAQGMVQGQQSEMQLIADMLEERGSAPR